MFGKLKAMFAKTEQSDAVTISDAELRKIMNQCAEQAALSVMLHIEARMRVHYAEHHPDASDCTVEQATDLCAKTGRCAIDNLTIALTH